MMLVGLVVLLFLSGSVTADDNFGLFAGYRSLKENEATPTDSPSELPSLQPSDIPPVNPCPPIDVCGTLSVSVSRCEGINDEKVECIPFADFDTFAEMGFDCSSAVSCGKVWLPFVKSKNPSLTADRDQIPTIIRNLKGGNDPASSFQVHRDMLTEQDRQFLRQLLDENFEVALAKNRLPKQSTTTFNSDRDYRLHLDPSRLQSLLPQATWNRLTAAIHPDYDLVRTSLRRSIDNGNATVDYHSDGSERLAFVIHLDEDRLGGDLHYLVDEVVVPELKSGDGVMHWNDIIHGVSSFHGVRRILFLMGMKKDRIQIINDDKTAVVLDEL